MSSERLTSSSEVPETRGEVRIDLQLASEHVTSVKEGQDLAEAYRDIEAAQERAPRVSTHKELMGRQGLILFTARRAKADSTPSEYPDLRKVG